MEDRLQEEAETGLDLLGGGGTSRRGCCRLINPLNLAGIVLIKLRMAVDDVMGGALLQKTGGGHQDNH